MKSLALEWMDEKIKEMSGQPSLDEHEAALRETAAIAQVRYEEEEASRAPWHRPRRFATMQAYRDR